MPQKMTVSFVGNVPNIDKLMTIGTKVQCDGRLYCGTGVVIDVLIPDAKNFAAVDNQKYADVEDFPVVFVRPDDPDGELPGTRSILKNDGRSKIRYNATDLLAGKLKVWVKPADTLRALAAKYGYSYNALNTITALKLRDYLDQPLTNIDDGLSWLRGTLPDGSTITWTNGDTVKVYIPAKTITL